MAQAGVAHELADIEGVAVVREVAVLRRDREVGGLRENHDVVRVRYVAHRRGRLEVRHGRVGDDERRRVRGRDPSSERHVRGDPVHELDSRAIAWNVKVHDEEHTRRRSRVAGIRRCPPYRRADVRRVCGFYVKD